MGTPIANASAHEGTGADVCGVEVGLIRGADFSGCAARRPLSAISDGVRTISPGDARLGSSASDSAEASGQFTRCQGSVASGFRRPVGDARTGQRRGVRNYRPASRTAIAQSDYVTERPSSSRFDDLAVHQVGRDGCTGAIVGQASGGSRLHASDPHVGVHFEEQARSGTLRLCAASRWRHVGGTDGGRQRGRDRNPTPYTHDHELQERGEYGHQLTQVPRGAGDGYSADAPQGHGPSMCGRGGCVPLSLTRRIFSRFDGRADYVTRGGSVGKIPGCDGAVHVCEPIRGNKRRPGLHHLRGAGNSDPSVVRCGPVHDNRRHLGGRGGDSDGFGGKSVPGAHFDGSADNALLQFQVQCRKARARTRDPARVRRPDSRHRSVHAGNYGGTYQEGAGRMDQHPDQSEGQDANLPEIVVASFGHGNLHVGWRASDKNVCPRPYQPGGDGNEQSSEKGQEGDAIVLRWPRPRRVQDRGLRNGSPADNSGGARAGMVVLAEPRRVERIPGAPLEHGQDSSVRRRSLQLRVLSIQGDDVRFGVGENAGRADTLFVRGSAEPVLFEDGVDGAGAEFHRGHDGEQRNGHGLRGLHGQQMYGCDDEQRRLLVGGDEQNPDRSRVVANLALAAESLARNVDPRHEHDLEWGRRGVAPVEDEPSGVVSTADDVPTLAQFLRADGGAARGGSFLQPRVTAAVPGLGQQDGSEGGDSGERDAPRLDWVGPEIRAPIVCVSTNGHTIAAGISAKSGGRARVADLCSALGSYPTVLSAGADISRWSPPAFPFERGESGTPGTAVGDEMVSAIRGSKIDFAAKRLGVLEFVRQNWRQYLSGGHVGGEEECESAFRSVAATSVAKYDSAFRSWIYWCRDSNLDFRIPVDKWVAAWLRSVGYDAAASMSSSARTGPKAKVKNFLSAINWIFARARGWHMAGSLVVKRAIEMVAKLKCGAGAKENRTREARDMILVFNYIDSLGETDDLSDEQLMAVALTLMWFDAAARESMMRGLQAPGPDFTFIDGKGAQCDARSAEAMRYRFRAPKGGGNWSSFVTTHRIRQTMIGGGAQRARRVCSVTVMAKWVARRQEMLDRLAPPNDESKDVLQYGPGMWIYVGKKRSGNLFYHNANSLATLVHQMLVDAKFIVAAVKFQRSHLIRAYAESAVRSANLSQFSDDFLAGKIDHGKSMWESTYRCALCQRHDNAMRSLADSKRSLIRFEEVIRR